MHGRLPLLLLLVAVLAAPLSRGAGATSLQSPPAAAGAPQVSRGEPATLRYWNRDLVTLRASLGSVTPEHRVQSIEARLAALPELAIFEEVKVDPVQWSGVEGLSFSLGPHYLLSLLPDDLDPAARETLESAGEALRQRLVELQVARREQGSGRVLLRATGWSALATLAWLLAMWAVARSRLWVRARLERWLGRTRTLVVRRVNLGAELSALLGLVLNIVAWALWLSTAYLWATFVLSSFPYTAPWGESLGAELELTASTLFSSAVGAIPDLIAVVVIVLLARGITRVVAHLFERVEHGQIQLSWLEPDSARATRRLVVGAVWLFAIVAAYPYVPGSRSEAFKGVSVLLGLMVSLGSSGVVNQVMSGFVVVLTRGARTGDYAKVGDVEGMVTEIGLLSVKIRTARGELVTVPNAVALSRETINYTRLAGGRGAVVATTVTIGYDAPWRQVHALLLEAAARTAGLRKEPAPRVLQRALSDFYVEYQLVGEIEDAATRVAVLSELHGHVQDSFNEHGVQILSPHFVAQPAEAVVVPREKWHAPPAAPPAKG